MQQCRQIGAGNEHYIGVTPDDSSGCDSAAPGREIGKNYANASRAYQIAHQPFDFVSAEVPIRHCDERTNLSDNFRGSGYQARCIISMAGY